MEKLVSFTLSINSERDTLGFGKTTSNFDALRIFGEIF